MDTTPMIGLHMSEPEITLVIGALSFLASESPMDSEDEMLLGKLTRRLESILTEQD